MTEDTTGKVNELISDAAVHRIRAALDVIAAVSAERDLYERRWLAAREVMRMVEADRDRLHKAITEALATPISARSDYEMRCILRASLGKEGNDDE